MKGKAHACIGLLTYYNYSLLTGESPNIIPAALCVSFSLLPDLDHYQSILSKKLSFPIIEHILESLLVALILLPTLYIYKIKGISHYLFAIAVILLTAVIGIVIKKSIIRKLSISLAVLSLYFISRNFTQNQNFLFLMIFLCILPWLSHRSFSHSLSAVILVYFILRPLFPSSLAASCSVSYASHIFFGDLLTPSGVPIFFPFSRKRFRLIRTVKSSKKIVPIMEFLVILTLGTLAVHLTFLLLL